MAKTNCHSVAGPSTSPRPPRSRRRCSPPGLVAFLATICIPPLSTHAHPLTPPETALPFLYPPFIHQPTPPVAKRSLPPPSSSDATTNTPSPPPPTGCYQERSDLPDKYVLGDDGYWHKTKWSLYGSSQCTGSCPPPSAVQDADARNDSSVTLLPSTTSMDGFDVSSLPTGWNTPNNASRQGTVIILSLSVALAVIILVMMLSCVIWRRRLIPKKDPEKKRRQSSEFADDDTSRSIREAKVAQRRWTKAVSRWRSNVRFSARRRRTDRAIARSASYSTLGQEEDGRVSEPEHSPSSSRSSSPTPTLRSRVSTNQDAPPSPAASVYSATSRARAQSSRASSPRPQNTSPYSIIPPHPASPVQPPAYHPQPPVPSPPSIGDHSPPYTHSDSCSPNPSKPPLSSSCSQPNDGDSGHLGPLSGHVATDDKALLSRRAALASAPPGPSSHAPPSATVPSIEDDDDLEFSSEPRLSSLIRDAFDPPEQRPPYLPPTSLLPSPPSKGKLKYDYSRDMDLDVNYDIVTVEPGLGPSAPPFEESEAVPSAPPLDLDVPIPSAPVMVPEWEDDRQDGAHRMDADTVMTPPGHVSLTLPGDGRVHVVDGATPASEADTAPSLPR